MPTLQIKDRLCLDFETFGVQAHPAILLVAGAGAPAAFWPAEFCQGLARKGFYVTRYSHRDTGASTHFDTPYGIDALLDDLFALMDHLTDQPLHLVGHSMGGYLTQLAMCRSPSRIATATSISAGPTVSPERAKALQMSSASEETWQILLANQPIGRIEADLPGWLSVWRFLNGNRPFEEDMAAGYTSALYEGDPRNAQVARNHIHAMSTLPDKLADDLTQSRTPLLVLHGQRDPLVPFDNGEASARLAPMCTLVRLDQAGHMFFSLDSWADISAALLGHITKETGLKTP